MQEVAKHFLDTYRRGSEVDGGWKFAKALQQAQLDYSEASLLRLDQLFDAIVAKADPQRSDFVDELRGRNFCSLIAFYLIDWITRQTGAVIEWHDRESALKVLPADVSMPAGSMPRLVAAAPEQGAVLLPLPWVEARLLDPEHAPSTSRFVEQTIAVLERDGPLVWARAVDGAGKLASMSMWMVLGGGTLAPTSILPQADGSHRFVTSLDAEQAPTCADVSWQASAQDVVIRTQAGSGQIEDRTDALLVEVRTEGERPLRLTLAFPYRPASESKAFAILKTRLVDANLPEALVQRLMPALDRGIRSFRWPGEATWDGHCAEVEVDGDVKGTAAEASAPAPPITYAKGTAEEPDNTTAPCYASGDFMQAGDVVLADRGVTPARIVAPGDRRTDEAICRYEDWRGLERELPHGLVPAHLLLVARAGDHSPAGDELAATCAGWLQQRLREGASSHGLTGATHARFAMGTLLRHGVGVESHVGMAIRNWQAAADAAYPPAECALGVLHLDVNAGFFDPDKALKYLRRSASNGYPPALGRLGAQYESERLGPDLKQALTLYQQAAAGHDGFALFRLARLYLNGEGVDRDPQRGVELMKQAAATGELEAQFVLAEWFRECADYEPCVYWYKQAAAQGHAIAINNLADKYEHGQGTEQDLAKAVELYRKAADLDIIAAWYSLGNMAAEGRGLPQDSQEAIRWMRMAANHDFLDSRERLAGLEQGQLAGRLAAARQAMAQADQLDPEALYEAATALYNPDVVDSMAPAFEVFVLAARRGHAESQHQVGFRYRRGLGVQADPVAALQWYEKSAAQGNVYSLEDLGEFYESGELGPADPRRAFDYTRRAVQAGAFLATYRLARMYRDGLGTEPDPQQALLWMRKAAGYGLDGSAEALKAMEAEASDKPGKRGWKFW